MRRKHRWLAALALALASTASGCFGSFAVTHEVWKRNRRIDGRLPREGVFFALLVVPVYECALIADLLVFNTVELISGDNPMGERSEDDETSP